ncbi:MAG: hypothetical protein DRH26_00600 [Deltaproteobacteria bacterium]|nr:MAG: hypothetical protein DRH26_00600 [Deltaproteobacteria bacterium]
MESVCGVNLLPEKVMKKYDLYCPAIPNATRSLNAFKRQCLIRQQDPRMKTCFGGCKIDESKVKKSGNYHGNRLTNKHSQERAVKIYTKVMKLVVKGLSTKEISKKLEVSRATVYRAKKWSEKGQHI